MSLIPQESCCKKKNLGGRLSVRTWWTLKARLRSVGDPEVIGSIECFRWTLVVGSQPLWAGSGIARRGQSQGRRSLYSKGPTRGVGTDSKDKRKEKQLDQ